MKTNSWVLLVGAAGVGLATGIGSACHRDIDSGCYERDPSLDYDGDPAFRPQSCGWDATLPDPPDGYARTNKIWATFTPSEDAPCDPCDVERLDQLLRDKIEERCPGQKYTGLARACYAAPEESGNEYCSVAGTYFANFEITVSSCNACDPATGECGEPIPGTPILE